MDPIGALLLAVIAASMWVSDWGADVRDSVRGHGMPRHERRTQQRAQDHERRMAAQAQRHAERLAGMRGPTFLEALTSRIRHPRPRKTRDEFGPVRGWWWDLCEDTAVRLTEERHARHERTKAGEQAWQRAWDWASRRAEQAWRDRAGRRARVDEPGQEQPRRRWVDSERVDRPDPDPGWADASTVEAEVADQQPTSQPATSQLSASTPHTEWGVIWIDDHDQVQVLPRSRSEAQRTVATSPQDYELARREHGADWLVAATGRSIMDVTPPAGGDEQRLRVVRTRDVTQRVARDAVEAMDAAEALLRRCGNCDGHGVTRGLDDPDRTFPCRVCGGDGRNHEHDTSGGAAMSHPAPTAQAAAGVALNEASANMTASNATHFAAVGAQLLQAAASAYSEAVADLASSKQVSGPALASFQQAEAALEEALRHTVAGGRVTADHAARADEYRDYQAITGSGDAKSYAELR